MKTISLGLLGLIAGAGVALAADPVVYVPPVSPPSGHFSHEPTAYDWSGLYLGAYVGALGGRFNGDADEPGLSGLDAGAEIQYNAVYSNVVLSPYLAVTLPVQESELFGVPVKVQWAAQAGVRVGLAYGRFLPYIYGGGVIGAAHAVSIDETHTHTGFTLGAGADYAVDDRWVVGARYAFYSLGAQEYFGMDIGWQGHSILATLKLKLQ